MYPNESIEEKRGQWSSFSGNELVGAYKPPEQTKSIFLKILSENLFMSS